MKESVSIPAHEQVAEFRVGAILATQEQEHAVGSLVARMAIQIPGRGSAQSASALRSRGRIRPLSTGGPTLNPLSVASLTLRKSHTVLLGVLSDLKGRDWQQTCDGSLSQSPPSEAIISTRLG
jgi:hypothetical protein